jgi:hypothetical protein
MSIAEYRSLRERRLENALAMLTSNGKPHSRYRRGTRSQAMVDTPFDLLPEAFQDPQIPLILD